MSAETNDAPSVTPPPLRIGARAIIQAGGWTWSAVKGDGYWLALRVHPDAALLCWETVVERVFDDGEVDWVYPIPERVH